MTSPPRTVDRFQNNFTEMFLLWPFTKIAKMAAKAKNRQEAHGPRLAHLSDKATADMHMLCDIFPILSLQLMNGSSF